ncbi:MAG TPA: large-conductance mechanosensitive channel protein MscL, partial [Paludibacteraceae bacterium]|nr:large-conductance mechanosensitive channel protein MscL [Paludibacteraceae bacterium]
MSKSKVVQEFKQFIMRGNVIDLAVGIIIGGAFSKIVTSVVSDVIMPPIGWLIGGVDFSQLKVVLPANPLAPEGTVPAAIAYGAFIQNIIDFLIIGLAVFLLIKAINAVGRKKKEEEAPKE